MKTPVKTKPIKEQGAVTISRNGYVQELERERDELLRWTSVNGVIELQHELAEARESLEFQKKLNAELKLRS